MHLTNNRRNKDVFWKIPIYGQNSSLWRQIFDLNLCSTSIVPPQSRDSKVYANVLHFDVFKGPASVCSYLL